MTTDPDDVVVRFAPDHGPVRFVPDMAVSLIHPDPKNLRTDLADLDDLARDMSERQLTQPIVVRPADDFEGYTIIAGHRRYAASQRIGWTTIPTLVRGPMPSVEVLEAMFSENTQRVSLDPIAEATALREIFHARKFGSPRQLAMHVGKTEAWCRARLDLLDLPAEVQARVAAGELNLGEAAEQARTVRGLPPRRAGSPGSPSVRTAPRTSRAEEIAAAIRRERAALRRLALDVEKQSDAAAIAECANRLDDLARRVETGDRIR